MVARALPCLVWLQQNYIGRCCGAHRSHAMGKERVLGEGGLAAVSSTQWGVVQDNRCLCSKNSWLCECFPRRNPNLQHARSRQQHVGCQRSRTGTSQKAKQTHRQIGSVATRGLKEQVVKLYILLKDTLGLETGCARLAGQLASLQSQNAWPFPEQGQSPQHCYLGHITATAACFAPSSGSLQYFQRDVPWFRSHE